MNKDLKDKTLNELEQIVVGMGQKKYLGGYIFSFIQSAGIRDISEITSLSKAFRKELAQQGYYISQLHIIDRLTDPDGTVKYLFELGDGNRVETVLLVDGRRKTLCVSTQVGCAVGCTFCATAKVKLRRNLTAGEIVNQVYTVQRENGTISNVVYMGMGEPLLNYNNVIKSVRILNHPAGRNIGIRHLTISSCGIAPAIKKLANEDIFPRLSVSLNAPTGALRTRLMPINAKYPIAELIKVVKYYQKKTGQRVTFEYVMIKGLNDSLRCAGLFVELLRDIRCNVNLIEYNPHPHCEFIASTRGNIERFVRFLQRAGIETTVRFKRGQKISAACGQLGAGWIDTPSKKAEKLRPAITVENNKSGDSSDPR